MMQKQLLHMLLVLAAVVYGTTAFAEAPKKVDEAKTKADMAQIAKKHGITPMSEADLSAYRKRLDDLRSPRDKYLAQVGAVTKQIEARKVALLQENEDAAALMEEVTKLEKAIEEKRAALKAVYDADKMLVSLNETLKDEKENFMKSQAQLRNEMGRTHREHYEKMMKAKREQAVAEAKRKAEVEKAKSNEEKPVAVAEEK